MVEIAVIPRPLKVFIGLDPRQPLAYTVLAHSIIRHASVPVSITALSLPTLPIKRCGLTEFTFSRFLVPFLCGYVGTAAFLDPDMICKADIKEFFDCADYSYDVHVMQNQPRFEWSSAMLFNCARCRQLTPEFIEDTKNNPLDLAWAKSLGPLPFEWNHCVGYAPPRNDAKLYHFTKGIPVWPETQGQEEDSVWFEAMEAAAHTVSHAELMGRSVHVRSA